MTVSPITTELLFFSGLDYRNDKMLRFLDSFRHSLLAKRRFCACMW